MTNTNGSRPIFNAVRAKRDADYAAGVLLDVARRRVKYIRAINVADRDDAVSRAVVELMQDWRKGTPLSDLLKWVDARLYRRGVDLGRSADRQPAAILDAPLKGDVTTTFGELIADPATSVEDRVILGERLAELKPIVTALNEYLAEASPRVKLIHEMAVSGMKRPAISVCLADQHGITASPDVVAQVISRDLKKRFPELGFLWENQQR